MNLLADSGQSSSVQVGSSINDGIQHRPQYRHDASHGPNPFSSSVDQVRANTTWVWQDHNGESRGKCQETLERTSTSRKQRKTVHKPEMLEVRAISPVNVARQRRWILSIATGVIFTSKNCNWKGDGNPVVLRYPFFRWEGIRSFISAASLSDVRRYVRTHTVTF